MNDFKEINIGDTWARFIQYDNDIIGIMLPFHGETITVSGTLDELGEFAVRLLACIAKIDETGQ